VGVTDWPGRTVKTDEELREVLAIGPKHLAICTRCERPFYRNKPDTTGCYSCWYVGAMESVEETYSDVMEALRAVGHEAAVIQTGGMCMAIQIAYAGNWDRYLLLTDAEDVLSRERHEDQGWGLGVYDETGDDSDGMPMNLFEDEGDILTAERKTPEEAVRLANQATEALRTHLEQGL
jgi:hypothetical protein